MSYIRLRTMQILDQDSKDDKASLWCDRIIRLVILLNVFAIIIESYEDYSISHSREFLLIERFSVVFFTIEFVLRLWSNASRFPDSTWRGRKNYLLSFHGFVDMVSIIPSYLQILFPGADMRIMRVLRLIRLLKLSHYSTAIEDLYSAIYSERRSFVAVIYLLSIAIVASSSLMYYAEADVQPDKFSSIPQAIYWSVITLTTVGYGDVSPITPVGKMIAIMTAFMGVSTVAIFTGIVATSFVNQLARKKVIYEQQMREAMSDGILDVGEDQLLRGLQSEFGLSDEMVVEIARRVAQNKI
jgi:voltage-gated potassium channel